MRPKAPCAIFEGLIEAQGMCFAKPDPALYYAAFNGADIVHFFMPFRFCRQGEKYARQMKIPSMAAFHVQPENITSSIFLGTNKRVNSWLYHWFNRRFYSRFGHFHCPSSFIAVQLKENGYKSETHLISNVVSRAFYRARLPGPAEWEGKFVILMIGRYSREKRQDLLIKAAGKSRHAGSIQLVFAGKGPEARRYKRLGARLPGRPVMKFMDQQELLQTIHRSDLYVHASDAEIEGISCLEAMACGLVPVISDAPLSATHQYALCPESLFRAGDAGDLAEKIDYWIEHPRQKEEMGRRYALQQGQNRADICTKKMVELYGRVIEAARIKKPEAAGRVRRFLAPRPERLASRLQASSEVPAAITALLAGLVAFVLAAVNRLFLGLRIEGTQNHLRGLKGGAVSVCNHIHPLDCTMVKRVFWNRKLWIISLRKNFYMPIVGALIKLLGAVPLGGSFGEQGQIQQQLERRLQKGDVVHYFPEGMLVPYYSGLRGLWGGAFAASVRTGCPVVPMVLCPRRGRGLYRLKRKPCLTLKILNPVYPAAGLSPKKARQQLQQRVEKNMRAALEEAQR
ncbi:MAG: glycosyltransferase [Oscillospiraceae bacterium]